MLCDYVNPNWRSWKVMRLIKTRLNVRWQALRPHVFGEALSFAGATRILVDVMEAKAVKRSPMTGACD